MLSGRLFWALLVSATATVALPAGNAAAATLPVTTKVDELDGTPDHRCSLREAIRSANTNTAVGGCPAGSGTATDRIRVAAGVYKITLGGPDENDDLSGDLDITGDVKLTGAGSGVTVINGNGGVLGERVLEVLGGTVTIKGLSVRNGRSIDGGGGVNVESGAVTLKHVEIASNHADGNGGGLRLGGFFSTTANLTNVVVRKNDTDGDGGGIHADSVGNLSIARSKLSGNRADGTAGGLLLFNTSTTVSDAALSKNHAVGRGGAIHMSGSASLQLYRSTVSGNESGDDGGAIYQTFSESRIYDSTFAKNVAADSGGAIVYDDVYRTDVHNSTLSRNRAGSSGGAIHVVSVQDSLPINNATLYRNVADHDGNGTGDGGGISRAAGAVSLANSIVAGNEDSGPTLAPDCSGSPVSAGYNLIGATDGCGFVAATGDQTGTAAAPIDPALGPLSDNGGPTETHALLAGSAALGAGDPAAPGSCELADQRGAPRAAGECDSGAYERVSCFGGIVDEVGTSRADHLRGTDAADTFLTLDGADSVNGGGGNDRICAGGGKDSLNGGPGADRLDGGPGRDGCVGGPGHDRTKHCERTS